jgi:hypothetical protein
MEIIVSCEEMRIFYSFHVEKVKITIKTSVNIIDNPIDSNWAQF